MKHFNRYVLLFCALIASANIVAEQKPSASTPQATAIFAGGCFWCVEADFDKVPGVLHTQSGYAGGTLQSPTYEAVSRGGTGHAESVRVTYDPSKVTYEALLDYFWRTIDPTVKDRQFCDIGDQYRTAIFYQDDAQKQAATASKSQLEKNAGLGAIYTQIAPAGTFFPAEEYHQDYYKKNPIRYKIYRNSCGRDARLKEVWGTKH